MSWVTTTAALPHWVRTVRSSSRSGAAQRQIQRGERLVEKQQRGVGGQRAPQRHPLPLAAGELARVAPRQRLEPEARQDLGRARVPLGARPVAKAEGDIAGHGEVREQREALEDIARRGGAAAGDSRRTRSRRGPPRPR